MKRPILRYFGGKWILAPWIISHFPEHKIYVEPFGGAASVLLRKERSYSEVYNDINEEIVNVFKVARDNGEILKEQLKYTPFSRLEYAASYQRSDCPIDNARKTIIRSFMGFGSDAVFGKVASGFRSNSNRSGSTPAHDWKNYADVFDLIIERLRGVVIENKCAFEIMKTHDQKETLHYIDPPYVHSTRKQNAKHGYVHELNDNQHQELCVFIRKLKGSVILSGYEHQIYNELLYDWKRYKKRAYADGAKKRTEVLYVSPNVKHQGTLI